MNYFSKLQPYCHKVSIIVPSTINVNEEVDSEEAVTRTIETLSLLFGGASAVNQRGGWMSEEHGLVTEHNIRVYAYTDVLTVEKLDAVYEQAVKLAVEMNQEAIAVEIDNKMYFVGQPDVKILNVG